MSDTCCWACRCRCRCGCCRCFVLCAVLLRVGNVLRRAGDGVSLPDEVAGQSNAAVSVFCDGGLLFDLLRADAAGAAAVFGAGAEGLVGSCVGGDCAAVVQHGVCRDILYGHKALLVGSVCYGTLFFVSLPVFLRIDEDPRAPTPASRLFFHTMGANLVILCAYEVYKVLLPLW